MLSGINLEHENFSVSPSLSNAFDLDEFGEFIFELHDQEVDIAPEEMVQIVCFENLLEYVFREGFVALEDLLDR